MALAHRQRRRASTSARKRSQTEGAMIGLRLSVSGRKSNGFDNDLEDAQVPPAIKYLDQVALEMSVTKKHADVRYVMTIVFTFSSSRVVEQRKQTLERFFAALYGFLTDRKNFCCSVVMTVFADELVEFIYGDALQQYGLENPSKRELQRQLGSAGNAQKLQLLRRESERQFSRQSSLTNSIRGSVTDDDIVNDLNSGDCGICGSMLCGVANGSSSSALTASSLSDNDSNRSINSTGSNGSVFTPPWLGSGQKNGSGTGNSFSGSRRSSSRRRAATYYLTTLSCGHQFHDECIVPKLNESLKCPTCGRIQTNN
ncbi:Zinc finger, RING/FYVE/PHD-type [Phytophthora cactorum]|nr:Zinc finger, RING/FYVE/PHD-type [Phytophthora cactorum]